MLRDSVLVLFSSFTSVNPSLFLFGGMVLSLSLVCYLMFWWASGLVGGLKVKPLFFQVGGGGGGGPVPVLSPGLSI